MWPFTPLTNRTIVGIAPFAIPHSLTRASQHSGHVQHATVSIQLTSMTAHVSEAVMGQGLRPRRRRIRVDCVGGDFAFKFWKLFYMASIRHARGYMWSCKRLSPSSISHLTIQWSSTRWNAVLWVVPMVKSPTATIKARGSCTLWMTSPWGHRVVDRTPHTCNTKAQLWQCNWCM